MTFEFRELEEGCRGGVSKRKLGRGLEEGALGLEEEGFSIGAEDHSMATMLTSEEEEEENNKKKS